MHNVHDVGDDNDDYQIRVFTAYQSTLPDVKDHVEHCTRDLVQMNSYEK